MMHDGFPLSHKLGLGVGVPAALVLGLMTGWLLFRRRRKRDSLGHEVPASEMQTHESGKDGNPSNHGGINIHEAPRATIYEAPSNHPVAIGQPHKQNVGKWGGELDNGPALIRYEMDAASLVARDKQDVDIGEMS
jgi:hypothetical protein